jgi:small subunit ribosomal protein S5e
MTQYAGEVKLFGKWSFEDVEVKDMSLEDYIACRPKYAQFLPHSQGRWQKKRFRKAQCPIVERLVCSMMRYGRNNGKKVMAVRIVKHCFEIVHLLTEQNPVQVYVEAVINCGPREDSTRVGGGGAVRRQACDVSTIRRVNQAIYLITTGAREASFRNIKTIAECLADEIMNAAKVRTVALSPPHPLRRQSPSPGRLRPPLLPLLSSSLPPRRVPAINPAGLVEQLRHQEEG